MTDLHDLVHAANAWLSLDSIPDYPGALNGLQLENSGKVAKIAAAVDGIVSELPVEVGTQVESGTVLAVVTDTVTEPDTDKE